MYYIRGNGTLFGLVNIAKDAVDAFIPHKLPSGEVIRSIGSDLCSGYFSSIVIDENISKIEGGAFRHAFVDTVTWPSSCFTIPVKCFEDCSVKQLLNIDHVTQIDQAAFQCSEIKEFDWPANCKTIPKSCFAGSCLTSISGIGNVEKICDGAFKKSSIQELNWPDKCHFVPYECFELCHITRIGNTQSIHEIESYAFENAAFSEKLDFSSSIQLDIHSSAFHGVDNNMVTFPYYYQLGAFDFAFK